MKLGSEDPHPNILGHRLIAERLFDELKKRPELLPNSLPYSLDGLPPHDWRMPLEYNGSRYLERSRA